MVFCGISICVEVCSVDLVVNLYFVFSVLFVVGLDGIKNKLEVLVLIDCNIYVMSKEECMENGIVDFLVIFVEVLEEFKLNEVMVKVLGEYLFEYFIEVKEIEWDMFCM